MESGEEDLPLSLTTPPRFKLDTSYPLHLPVVFFFFLFYCLPESYFKYSYKCLEITEAEKVYHANTNQNKAGVVVS